MEYTPNGVHDTTIPVDDQGLPIEVRWDEVAFTYTGGDITQKVYKYKGTPVRTDVFTYVSGKLTGITKEIH